MTPILYLVIPCYNEEQVLPITAPIFVGKLGELIEKKEISEKSRVLFVNDGSSDSTWEIIEGFSREQTLIKGICLSRNMGHQNALLAGLMTAKEECDVTISIDCDGQDDINAVDKMIAEYKAGCDIVYGVRESRKTDSFFKRHSAQFFYKLLNRLGAKTIYNHADYRLMSSRALVELEKFKEVNIYLRGMVPMVGFKSTSVAYDRTERLAGKSLPYRYNFGAFKPCGNYLVDSCLLFKLYRCGLVLDNRDNLLLRRNSDTLYRSYRRIYRKDIYGNQGTTQVYYKQEDRRERIAISQILKKIKGLRS